MREFAGAPLLDAPPPPEPRFPCIAAGELRKIAWERCGIIRSGYELAETCERLSRIPVEPTTSPNRELFELRSIHTAISIVARCALARQESRGAHYRTDYPTPRPEFQKHSAVDKDHDVTFE
jgi:L-aspartate oxidase